MQTEQLLCWSGMTDTEHSAISGSKEEVSIIHLLENHKQQVTELANLIELLEVELTFFSQLLCAMFFPKSRALNVTKDHSIMMINVKVIF